MRGKKVKKHAVFAAMFIALFFPVSLSAAETASVTLNGTMGSVLELDLTPAPVSSNLDLSRDHTETDLLVGTVIERSNNPTGYTVTITAESGAYELINQSNTNRTIPYTLTYGGVSVTTSPQTVTNANGMSGGSGETRELRISYTTGNEFNGDYKHTLTFEIANK